VLWVLQAPAAAAPCDGCRGCELLRCRRGCELLHREESESWRRRGSKRVGERSGKERRERAAAWSRISLMSRVSFLFYAKWRWLDGPFSRPAINRAVLGRHVMTREKPRHGPLIRLGRHRYDGYRAVPRLGRAKSSGHGPCSWASCPLAIYTNAGPTSFLKKPLLSRNHGKPPKPLNPKPRDFKP
jgi:hypothetical protein